MHTTIALTLTLASAALALGCGGGSYVHSDTALDRVVVYRNGVAYFERSARIDADHLDLSVPADKLDDFLKSLTVVDLDTQRSAPVEYPSAPEAPSGGMIDMRIRLFGARPHRLKLAYVTEAPAWKPSYRVALGKDGKVTLEGLAIVDNASGEDWSHVQLGVAASSALSFRFDLRSVRFMRRETLQDEGRFAIAPPTGGASYDGTPDDRTRLVREIGDEALGGERLPFPEQLAKSEETLARMDQHAQVIRRMLEQGRAQRDVVKVLCLNDKLGQVEVALRSARERRGALEAAGRRGDVEVADHEHTVLKVLRQRSEQFMAEANQCVGEELAFVGNAKTTIAVEPAKRGEAAKKEKAHEVDHRAAPEKPAELQAKTTTADPGKDLDGLAERLKAGKHRLVIEGFAGARDADPAAASLARANRARDRLLERGVDPERVAAVGGGRQRGHEGGVRIVEVPSTAELSLVRDTVLAGKAGEPTDPIGSAHFESITPATVARGSSAMVSMVKAETEGEVVYLWDRESARGNEVYPFRAVRLKNPTGEALESGPVAVFGEGRFIGEGLCEPIPAHSVAFVPFALDRQIVVERKETERDDVSRILSGQRGVLSVGVVHTRSAAVTLKNRQAEKATVYLRHTVPAGYELGKAPFPRERIGAAHLFRVELPPSGEVTVVIEEGTPQTRTLDLRTSQGIDLLRGYLTSSGADPALKEGMNDLLARTREMEEAEQRIATVREQLTDYRERLTELAGQVVSLRKASAGSAGALLQHLEQKLRETNDRIAQLTVDLVGLEEKRMIAKIRRDEALSSGLVPEKR